MEEALVIVLGLIFGSFLNVVIHRVPQNQSIVKPRSYCPVCQTAIKYYDNIPVVSYFILGGKCRYCQAAISIRYPLIEMFTAFTFWLCYFFFWHHLVYAVFASLFLWLIIALAVIDLIHMILPDELTLAGAAVFFIYSFFNPRITAVEAFATAFGSALLLTGIYFFYLKVRKIEALGFGDIKMMLLLGAFLGLNNLVVAIVVASLSGLLVGIFFIIFKGKDLKMKLPFGTFLSLGSYVSVFWGSEILRAIKSLYM